MPRRSSGTEGGGRYDFDSAGIPNGKGGLLKLQEGDRIQFYVEVFGRADPDGTPGRSALREKEVVNQKDFLAWLDKKEDQKERIRQLEEKQRGVAGMTSLLPEERPYIPPQRTLPNQGADIMPDGDTALGRSWQLLGPFPNDKDAGHAHAYPPEAQKIDSLDLASVYDGLNGKVRWQLHHSSTDKIDLQKFFDHGEAGVAYAVCWIKHAWRGKAILATGSDDGIKVWLNRQLVLDKAVHREAIPGDDKTPILLEDGWQELLVKVDNRFGTWAFYLDLLDPGTGKPLRGQRLQVPHDAVDGHRRQGLRQGLADGRSVRGCAGAEPRPGASAGARRRGPAPRIRRPKGQGPLEGISQQAGPHRSAERLLAPRERRPRGSRLCRVLGQERQKAFGDPGHR